MREILINQIAGFVLSLLNVNADKFPTSVVQKQGSHVSIAVIDFNTSTFKTAHFVNKKRLPQANKTDFYYDLASLTKPLTLASSFLATPETFSEEEMLLLNHKGSLPPIFKVVPHSDEWKEHINSLSVKPSSVVYSDTSAVRLMLNLEKKSVDVPAFFDHWLDGEVKHWRDLSDSTFCPSTGKRNKIPIHCDVHDDKAFMIDEFVTHAGLFGTVSGVAKTLINLNTRYALNKTMTKLLPSSKERFLLGWEVNKNLESRPAGIDADEVFGHRGYTGTSIWVNTKLNLGLVILTNTSSLENGRNNQTIASAKHEFRQKITTYLWKLYSTKI